MAKDPENRSKWRILIQDPNPTDLDGNLDRYCVVSVLPSSCSYLDHGLNIVHIQMVPWSWWWSLFLGGGVQSPSRRIACKMWCVGGCALPLAPNCELFFFLMNLWWIKCQEPAGFDGWMKIWTGLRTSIFPEKNTSQEVDPRMEAMRLEIMEMAKARQDR